MTDLRDELADKIATLEHCDRPGALPCARCYGYADAIVQLAVESSTEQMSTLRRDVERWAADSCKEPWTHALAHNALGIPQDYCAVCEMNWPCPSAVMLGWVKPEIPLK